MPIHHDATKCFKLLKHFLCDESITLTMDLFDEIHDLNNLLKDIQRKSKALLVDDDSTKQIKVVSQEKKREKASSAWAKSESSRSIHRMVSTGDIISDEVLKQGERIVKYTPPAYSMGKPTPANSSKKSKVRDIYANTPPPTAYRVVDSSSSKYKRPKTSSFGTAPKGDATNMVPIITTPNYSEDVQMDHDDVRYDVEYPQPKSYSFGTSRRPSANDPSELVDHPTTILHVHQADKWLYKRPSTPLMKPESAPIKVEMVATEAKESSIIHPDTHVNISLLSHVAKSPTPTIRPPLPKSEQLLAYEASKLQEAQIGPGTYQTRDDMATQLRRRSSGQIYKKPSPETEIALLKKHIAELTTAKALGPGYYHAELSADKLRTKSPSAIIPRPKPEDEVSIHLQRRRYYEEKAADAREYHDNQAEADDSILHPRTPTAVLYNKVSVVSSDAKLKQIHQRREAERIEEEANRNTYDVNLDLVERRSVVMVNMVAESQSRESMKKMLASKPGVIEAIYEKSRPRDVLYGPQLPVAWVPDRFQTVDDGEASPTREVMKLLRREQDAGIDSYESSTARNYLRSTLAGAITSKPTAIIREDNPTQSKKVDEEDPEIEALGPIDWLEEMNKREAYYKNNALRMDVNRGRDEVHVHSKGVVEVNEFSSSHLPARDQPVSSSHVNYPAFGSDAKGIFPFDKYLSREDAIGPNGEPPISSWNEEEERLDMDRDQVLDNEHLVKKRAPNIVLYRKDRFQEKKVDSSDHVGGTWFKGMAEEANRPAVVDFAKMQGRFDSAEDLEDRDNEGAVLDLEVPDKKDLIRKESRYLQFKDPGHYPRFDAEQVAAEDKVNEEALDLAPNHEYIERNRFKAADVRMDRMQGRNSLDADNNNNDVVDKLRTKGIVAYDYVVSENVAKAYDSTKGKRSKVSVIIAKQQGRYDQEDDPIDKEMMVDETAGRDIDGIGEARLKGPHDWSKQAGRNDDAQPDAISIDRQVLDLDRIQVDGQSKYKRAVSAPAWKSENGEARFMIEKPLAAPDAIYEDIDPGKFKKDSLQPLGRLGKKVVSMKNQQGRNDAVLMDEDERSEELDIFPNDDFLRRRASGAKISSNSANEPVPKDLDMEASVELDLDARPVATKHKSSLSISKHSGRRSTKIPEEIRAELSRGKEALILDPKPDATSMAKKSKSAIIPKQEKASEDFYIIDEDPFITDKPKKRIVDSNPVPQSRTNNNKLVNRNVSTTNTRSTSKVKVASDGGGRSSVQTARAAELSPPMIGAPRIPERAPENFKEVSANDLFLQLDKQLSDLNINQ
jgi:hypothetical protein